MVKYDTITKLLQGYDKIRKKMFALANFVGFLIESDIYITSKAMYSMRKCNLLQMFSA